MNSKKLLRFATLFYSLAAAEELPANSKDLDIILKNIEKLETFHARKKYAEKNLKHLSSGSSRVVYLTPENTVVKVAKNDKGLAQNKAEANIKNKSKYLNKILKHAKNFSWVESVFANKITEKEFKKMTKMDFTDFGDCIRYALREVSGHTEKEKPSKFDKIKENEMFKELVKIGKDNDLLGGDLAKISSFGEIDDHPVLIDAGLNKKIFEKFYESKTTSS